MSDDKTAVTRTTGNFASRLLSKAIAERSKGKTGEFAKPETLDFSPPAEEQAAVATTQAATATTTNS